MRQGNGAARTSSVRAGRRALLIGMSAAALAALSALAGCTSANPRAAAMGEPTQPAPVSDPSTAAPSADATPSFLAPKITLTPSKGTHDVNPTAPVDVNVAHGKLVSVKMLNSSGEQVTGTMSGNASSWHTTEVLGYSKTYRVTATVEDLAGQKIVRHSRFTTLTPNNMTLPYFNDIYGSTLQRGATYGVGMVAVVNFDEDIPNKKAAEKALHVTTSPHVDGAWYWTGPHTAHWRPEHFYKPGTKVTIDAQVYGKDFGGGLYGQSDEKTWFRIGAKHISVANAKTHHVKVFFNDKMVRRMPTSMGQGGVVQGDNGPIYLWTMPGIYTVIGHENPAIMSSDSYGLPSTSQYGYPPEKVYWSTKISTDGIYLHELDTTVWAQGHENVSHGCLNLNHDNAKWFYNHSRVGDVVKVVHSGGPKIQVWQGGDWSVPWSTWLKGGDI